MRLVSLTLENIKSYVNESIAFYDGVNFISGINGAGKTTVIEAIGCALFDSSPLSSQQKFIREGAKSGVITVVFEAADERLYRVVRRLRRPSGGSWSVIDEESGRELPELHGSQDVKAWLAASLGIAGGLEPSLLFEDVVAVSQGSFTAPFLERPERRKKIFNTVLQLESYREAFEKTSGLVTALKDRIFAGEAEIKSLLVRVEDLAACREQLKASREKADLLDKSLQELAENLARLEEETAVQERLRTELEKRESELQAVKIRLDNLCAQKERLESQLAEAARSREKAAAAEPGYREYLRLQEREKDLEEKRKSRESLKNEIQELQKQAAVLKAGIESEKESRRRQVIQGEAELKEIMAEGEKEKTAKQAIETRQSEVAGWHKKFEELKASWQFAGQAAERFEQVKAALPLHRENYEQLKQEKEKLAAALGRMEETERLARSVPGLEEGLAGVRERLNETKARAAALEENRSASSGGLCPFLKKPCLNVEGSLEDYFSREIEKITAEIPGLLQEEAELENRLAAARKAAGDLFVLRHQEERLQELERMEAQNRSSLEKEKETLSAEIGPARSRAFREAVGNAVKILKAAGISTGEEETAGREYLAQLVERYERLFVEFCRGFDPLEGRRFLEPLAQAAAQIKALADKLWERAESGFRETLQETGSVLAACEARLAALRDRFRKVNEGIKRINEDRTVQEKEEELAAKERAGADLQARLQQYDGLDGEWEKNKERKRELEPFFIQYMQNIEGAARLENLKNEKNKLEEETARRQEEEKRLENSIQDLRARYKADLLSSLKLERDRLVTEKAKKVTELEHALLEAEKNERQVREKEGYQQHILELERKMAAERKAQALLNLVRLVLNQSGEKMARVYREHLGREANLIYQQIAGENVHLVWEEDYEVKLKDAPGGKERERVFAQLSGGEKMTAALAVRLALLKQVAGLGVGFFDEPTANLDEKRRNNLARVIPGLAGDFRQLFLISHDDTFDAVTENIIFLEKEGGGGTKVVSG
ncbi:MAG: SMC family ATPase [Peptococcaceae bacterium]|jgi:exonuclease SbcC|nr:SMC family ATPase [Peptococcaceae bacterium]MDH7524581.1 SMC family ATPase [Peptococcaceae bacterium]